MEVKHAPRATEPSFSEGREWGLFGHVVVQILLAGALVAGAIKISTQHGERFDLTTERIHSLSDKTVEVLGEIESGQHRIEIYAFLDPTKSSSGFTDDAIRHVRGLLEDLLWKLHDRSERIHYEILDVHRQVERIEELRREFGISQENLVLVVAREESGEFHQKSLTLRDLAIAPSDPWSGRLIDGFKGDEAIVQAVRTVTAGDPVRICFTTGHGEVDPAARIGLLKAYLENEAYLLDTVDLREEGRVPEDCRVLVVAGASREFQREEIEWVREFVKAGGSLLYLTEPEWKTGLEEVLEESGIRVHDDLVLVLPTYLVRTQGGEVVKARGQYDIVLRDATLDRRHAVTSKLAESGYRVVFHFFRSVGPSRDDPLIRYSGLVTTPEDPETEELESRGWGGYRSKMLRQELGPDDRAGPLAAAAAVTRFFGDPSLDSTPRARIVAVGDTSFIQDDLIKESENREFAYAALLWLAGRDPIVLPPPEPRTWEVDIQQAGFIQDLTLPLLVLPFGVFFVGVFVWLARRY